MTSTSTSETMAEAERAMNPHDQAAVAAGETTVEEVRSSERRREEGMAMAAWLVAQGIDELVPEDEALAFRLTEDGLVVEFWTYEFDENGDVRTEPGTVRWPNGEETEGQVPVQVLRRYPVTMLPPAQHPDRLSTLDLINFLEWLDDSREVVRWGRPGDTHEETARRYMQQMGIPDADPALPEGR